MPTKKIDSKYISRQEHEIYAVSKKYGIPSPLVYFLICEIEYNKGKTLKKNIKGKPNFVFGKVVRTEFYNLLELMGYKDAYLVEHEVSNKSFLKLKKI